MEGRPIGGRGGSWKKVDQGAINSGEHRGRGRGGQHRGRGKRNYYRGHGRGENKHAFHPRVREKVASVTLTLST